MVTKYVPAVRLAICPLVSWLLHKKVKGGSPPEGIRLITPFESPWHSGFFTTKLSPIAGGLMRLMVETTLHACESVTVMT
jgi:hypothetical protein